VGMSCDLLPGIGGALRRIREVAMRTLCKGEKQAANLIDDTRLLCRGKLNELFRTLLGLRAVGMRSSNPE
jgi:hypothetical protein